MLSFHLGTIPQCDCAATERRRLWNELARSDAVPSRCHFACCCAAVIAVTSEIFRSRRQSPADLTFRPRSWDGLRLRSMQLLLDRGSALRERTTFFIDMLAGNSCSAQRDGAARPWVLRLGCLFLLPSVRKSLLIKSPCLHVGRESRELSNVSTFSTISSPCLVKVSRIPVTGTLKILTVLL